MDNVLWLFVFLTVAFVGYLAGASLTLGAIVACSALVIAIGFVLVVKCEHVAAFAGFWYGVWAVIFLLAMWVTYGVTAGAPTAGTFIHTYILR